MELTSKNSFYRDLDNIGSRAPGIEVDILIQRIYQADSVSSVPGMKQLKRSKQFEYKIELKIQTKIYWILCDVYTDRIDFVRIKSEAWCKANL